jgi:DNA-binding PadR family transcriptional regulator
MFEHGDLRYLLLHMLSEQPRHGYELIRAIEDRMGGRYTPSPGAIYPTLTMLEEQGLATVTEDGAKKRYALTAEGLAFLAANKPQVEAILARIGDAGGPARPDPRILRAIENLHTALRLRHGQGPIEEARATAIAAAIDAAVAEIERT